MKPEFYKHNEQINHIINQMISEKTRQIGDFVFSYVVLSKSNPVNLIMTSNAPHWYEPYRLNRRQLMDPVIIRVLAEADFYWDKETLEKSWGDIHIFDDARAHSIINGHTFVIHDGLNNAVMLTLVRKNGSLTAFKQSIETNREMLRELLKQCHTTNLELRGISTNMLRPERALVYSNGARMPLNENDIVGSEALLTQLLERRGYSVTEIDTH